MRPAYLSSTSACVTKAALTKKRGCRVLCGSSWHQHGSHCDSSQTTAAAVHGYIRARHTEHAVFPLTVLCHHGRFRQQLCTPAVQQLHRLVVVDWLCSHTIAAACHSPQLYIAAVQRCISPAVLIRQPILCACCCVRACCCACACACGLQRCSVRKGPAACAAVPGRRPGQHNLPHLPGWDQTHRGNLGMWQVLLCPIPHALHSGRRCLGV